MTLPFHPASSLFPLMDGVDFAALVSDIKAHGLKEPIVLCDGKVIDGRNRLRACEQAGVEPRFVEWEPDGSTITEWVVSKNLHRRHLTTAQRAALALDLLPQLETEARERQQGGQGGVLLPPKLEEATGESTAKAAELVGVGRSTVATVKAIAKRDETGDVVSQMRSGELNIAQAARQVGFERDGVKMHDSIPDSNGRQMPSVFYGKGDKFAESTEPLRRYLRAWSGRNFEFRHLAPKEAKKRLVTLRELAEGIEQTIHDLERRSETARLHL